MEHPFWRPVLLNALAPSMRSPSGITGWLARLIMRSVNPFFTKFAIQNRMDLKPTYVFVELGDGVKVIVEG